MAADQLQAEETRRQQEQLVDDTRNVMPSMVVRQQRQAQLGITSANPNHSAAAPAAPATAALAGEPIYVKSAANQALEAHWQQPEHLFDRDGLVLPKRLAHHQPLVVADQPAIRDLNRELKFNQAHGRNVLDQKSELKRAMERVAESRRKKELERDKLNRRTSLELRLEERAAKIAKESATTATQERTTSH